MNKRLISMVACGFLLSSEALRGMEQFDARRAATDPPHNHLECAEATTIDVTNNLSASGQSDRDLYYLQLAPAYGIDAEGHQQVVGYHAYGIPYLGNQQMYKRFGTLDDVLFALQTEWGIEQAQLDSTRDSLLKGERTEIGGHTARLLLVEKSMRSLGLGFDYPEP